MAIAEITAVVAASKAAYDIAKGMKSLKNEVERNESVSRLLETLLSVQMQALEVQRQAQALDIENHEIKRKLMEAEDWSKIVASYELKDLGAEDFVYAYKKSDDSGEPMHYLCPTCFDTKKKKSVLQKKGTFTNGTIYLCWGCRTEIVDKTNKKPPPPPRGSSSRKGSGYVNRW